MNEAERNVEISRRAFEAFSRGDLDATLADVHPDIEWHVAFRLPDLPIRKDVYRGHDEVRELLQAFVSGWERLTAEIEEVVDADEGGAILRVRFRGRGAESGIEVDQVVFYNYRIRDGLLVYSRSFPDQAAAQQDAGLVDDR